MKIKLIIYVIALISITALFRIWFHYCYAVKNITVTPFKETLSISISFLGSFGTLASIIFAFYLYIKQREKEDNEEKSIIRSNKPTFFIKIYDLYNSQDSNGQPALAIDLNIKNFSNSASSFSLQFDYLPNKKNNILVDFDYPCNMSDIFNPGENLNITAIFTSCDDILKPPKLEDIKTFIKVVYLDRLNNIIEDYFLLDKIKIKSIKFYKSIVLTSSGKVIEIK